MISAQGSIFSSSIQFKPADTGSIASKKCTALTNRWSFPSASAQAFISSTSILSGAVIVNSRAFILLMNLFKKDIHTARKKVLFP